VRHRAWHLVLLLIVFAAPAMRAQALARRSLPVPDLPGFRTLKGDFHLHTVFSDGNVWPTVHVQDAWRDGLDVVALTEHAEYQPHANDVNIDLTRSYAIAKPLADQLGMLLVPGIEITKPDPWKAPLVLPDGSAHFNALFVTDANALRTPDLLDALRRAKAQGAFILWDHPRFRVTRAQWFPQIARAFDEGLFQGMELVNGPDFYDEAFPWIAERRLTIIANSDAHDPVPAGTRRPITLLFARTADLDGVRDALVERRTAAWLGDDVWGAEEHLRGLWSGAIVVETPKLLRRPSVAPLLRVRNTSAIPMRAIVRRAPEWLIFTGSTSIAAEGVTLLRPAITGAAPTGEHHVDLELEIANLHTAPSRNLMVTLPLTIHVER
jgi:3',5'-nucleoside bisphosphate phosphatase